MPARYPSYLRSTAAVLLILLQLALGNKVMAQQYTYLGQFAVEDGPWWGNNPRCYSAREIAAVLYGGVPSDYAISTTGSDPAQVNHLALVDGLGDSSHLTIPVSEDFVMGVFYNGNPAIGSAYSAWVLDHDGSKHYNYVFRASLLPPVPSCTYVGRYAVEEGPWWMTNPLCYSPLERAAAVFGGVPTDYLISTEGSDPARINRRAWMDGLADDSFMRTPVSQDFRVGTFYWESDHAGTAYSAWVTDHSTLATPHYNYMFRVVAISVTRVRMSSAHEIQITTQRSFGSHTGHVTLDITINGTHISVTGDRTSNAGNPADQQPFVIDLSNYDGNGHSVPRFTTNQLFSISALAILDDGTAVNPDTKQAAILLPVVIVPGIQPFDLAHAFGGDGTYPGLEQYLKAQSKSLLASGEWKGDGFMLRADQTNYPTLYTLNYDTNNASFSQGASGLSGLILDVQRRTYADKVNLVTQSKGGLVARRFVVDHSRSVSGGVNRLIMCAPPNLGSVWTQFGAPLGFDYSNLAPVWPWYRKNLLADLHPSGNGELNRLNDHQLPGGVACTLIYSSSEQTPFTYTSVVALSGLIPYTFAVGDAVVPTVSSLGVWVDPNGVDPSYTIPAFVGVNIEYLEIGGLHFGYTDVPGVQAAIYSRVIADFN